MAANLIRRSASRGRSLRPRRSADREIVSIYAELAESGRHLLDDLLKGRPPRQWTHYPGDDAIDRKSGYQWFYHSHSPEDRPGSSEHGHFHVFARTDGFEDGLEDAHEERFRAQLDAAPSTATTRHLITIGMSPQGVPTSLFTVNRWVTGDMLVSGPRTIRLLAGLRLDTGHSQLDRLLEAVVKLFAPTVRRVIRERDRSLLAHAARGPGTLDDESFEVPSASTIQIDARIAAVRKARRWPRT